MRTGSCTVQQALTAEAASIVKQAVVLAKRRGHAQVTPLHVANTMLASSAGLFRTACLQSHSHPLQCKALELCFNVALNRLPTSSSSPMFGHQSHNYPSISNALVAAFKRAQAHQRRGSIENQQQPLLAVKIDLEQLIISILDDPSVSRVMREAGFSSTQVKTNVEQAVTLELSSQNPSPNSSNNSTRPKEDNHILISPSNHQSSGFKAISKKVSPSFPVKDEDMMSVVDSLMNKRRRSIVIVGECLASLEGVIKGVMDKVDNGDVEEALKEIKLISVPVLTFANIQREEVELRIGELTCLVKSLVAKGVVLYLGDLKWITDYRANNSSGGQGKFSYYCSVEHMIMELGRLVCSIGENGKFWLVGIATFQTYMRCRTGHNSLESVWGLHPITVPAGSLGLSLNSDSDTQLEHRSKTSENVSSLMIVDSGDEQQLTCCVDCSAKFEVEALRLQNIVSNTDSTFSSLPSWLKDERERLNSNHHNQNGVSLKELCKKWNSICNSSHRKQTKKFERSLSFPSTSPSSFITCFSSDQQYANLHQTRETSLRIYIPEHGEPRNIFSSNPNSSPNSTSSSDNMEMEYFSKFKEFNSENLIILSNALEEKVSWQRDIIREISGTILQCRSGMLKRKDKLSSRNGESKEETWLFFLGHDVQAKEKIARELARVVFGSYSKFVSIALSSFSSTKTDDYFRNKRSRDEQSCSYIERFAQAVSSNPHRVFFVEDVEQMDYCSKRGIKKATERGKIANSRGEEVNLSDAIIILSCERFSSRSRAVSPVKQNSSDGSDNEDKGASAMEENKSPPCVSLDLNISIVDHESVELSNVDDMRLLESVDRCVTFRIQEL